MLARVTESGGIAKWAHPIQGFPVAAWRRAGHRPLHAMLCICGVAAVCNTQATQAAIAEHSAQAEELRLHVEGRLQSLRPTGVQQAQQQINSILVEAARMFFPVVTGADDRVSAHPGYRASAKATWDLYCPHEASLSLYIAGCVA